MSNSGKIWDTREAYKQIRANTWIEPGNIGLYGGGDPSSNTVEQINISTNGNSTDFGDLTSVRYGNAGLSSPTRGVSGGGATYTGSTVYQNIIDYITIASTGNSTDFGDLFRLEIIWQELLLLREGYL